MNIKDKKTALDDDSLLYQKRDESFGKKDISGLNKKEKAGYFKDYYLKKVIIAVIAIALIASIINTTVFNRQEMLLGVAFVDTACVADPEGLNDYLKDALEITGKNDYLDLSNYNLDDYSSQIRFTTLTASNAIDIIFCDEANFEKYSGLGYFADLSQFLPADLYEKVKDRILLSSEVKTDENNNVIETYPAAPHGIDISGNALYKEYGGTADHVIIGVMANAEHTDNIIRTIEHLISYEGE